MINQIQNKTHFIKTIFVKQLFIEHQSLPLLHLSAGKNIIFFISPLLHLSTSSSFSHCMLFPFISFCKVFFHSIL
ncbi:hypothetical protein Lalb_Chr07g0190861 [Lupinus albus]|uniref:Uncharacterized protein n=1 Tax=Lupinus albus TaxID=3870 RepID=A0A6A4QA63_LUPAL|nr:hypothetical protein Lalb_Chr07g0190861 [Lupinus albus]